MSLQTLLTSHLPSLALPSFNLTNLHSFNVDSAHNNYSLYLIPVAWALSILAPRIYARYLYYTTKHEDMDVLEPRKWSKSIASDPSLDEQTRGRIERCEAAMNNGHENIAIFAAAVVAGNAAGMEAGVVNALAWGFIGSRVVFNLVYILQDCLRFPGRAVLRPVVFFAGVGCYMALFVKAGQEFQRIASLQKG